MNELTFPHDLVIISHGNWFSNRMWDSLLEQENRNFNFLLSIPTDENSTIIKNWDMSTLKNEEITIHKDIVPVINGKRTYSSSRAKNVCFEQIPKGKRIGCIDLDTFPIPIYTQCLLRNDLPVWGWISIFLDKIGGIQSGGSGIIYLRPTESFDPCEVRYDENFVGWGFEDMELEKRLTKQLGIPRSWNGKRNSIDSAPALVFHDTKIFKDDKYVWRDQDLSNMNNTILLLKEN